MEHLKILFLVRHEEYFCVFVFVYYDYDCVCIRNNFIIILIVIVVDINTIDTILSAISL